jgi:hypothetical protein
MRRKGLFKNNTMHSLLDELDLIECFEEPGHKTRIGEVTKRQNELFEAMGVVF